MYSAHESVAGRVYVNTDATVTHSADDSGDYCGMKYEGDCTNVLSVSTKSDRENNDGSLVDIDRDEANHDNKNGVSLEDIGRDEAIMKMVWNVA